LQPVQKQAEIDEASNIEESQSAGSAEDANNSDDNRNDSVQDAQAQSTATSAEVSVATTRRIRRQNAGNVNGQGHTWDKLVSYATITRDMWEDWSEGCWICRLEFRANDIRDIVAVTCRGAGCGSYCYHANCLCYNFLENGNVSCPRCQDGDALTLDERVRYKHHKTETYNELFFNS
jgi:hypothetical protein